FMNVTPFIAVYIGYRSCTSSFGSGPQMNWGCCRLIYRSKKASVTPCPSDSSDVFDSVYMKGGGVIEHLYPGPLYFLVVSKDTHSLMIGRNGVLAELERLMEEGSRDLPSAYHPRRKTHVGSVGI
ncbi:hypothetical protein PM082_019152, partial [Marasmius tenuissimus]